MWKTKVKANCAKKQRMNSRDNIFLSLMWDLADGIPMADGFYRWRIFPGDFISESFSDDLTVDPFLLKSSLPSQVSLSLQVDHQDGDGGRSDTGNS
jgi:hypothetical protein